MITEESIQQMTKRRRTDGRPQMLEDLNLMFDGFNEVSPPDSVEFV